MADPGRPLARTDCQEIGKRRRYDDIAYLVRQRRLSRSVVENFLATSCLFGAIAWLIFLAFSPGEERERLWVVAGDIILSGAITVVLAAAE
jgi:hypothetical protein